MLLLSSVLMGPASFDDTDLLSLLPVTARALDTAVCLGFRPDVDVSEPPETPWEPFFSLSPCAMVADSDGWWAPLPSRGVKPLSGDPGPDWDAESCCNRRRDACLAR